MNKINRLILLAMLSPWMLQVAQAGTTYVGQLLQTINLTQIAGTAVKSGSGTGTAGSLNVYLATDQPTLTNALSVTASPVAVSAPAVTKVGATTTSAQLIAANATRKGIEIDTDCANTDAVAINFGASAAVYATHKQIPACTNWQPPAGVTVTSAIQIISNSGTQNARVIEYP